MGNGTVNLSDSFKKIGDLIKGDKGRRIILIIGILGILLILLSTYWPKKAQTSMAEAQHAVDLERYTQELENRLTDIIESITGVGRAKVMVTLESGMEYIYADETQKRTGKSQDKVGNDTVRTQENNDIEQRVVLVDGEGGNQALIRMALQPKVKGVVVVCDGGDTTHVQQNVINAVTTALNISSARVCVIKSIDN